MKKLILLILIIIIGINTYSQIYLNTAINTKGVGCGVGALIEEKIDLNLNYTFPLTRNDIPSILSFNIGPRILLSHKEEDNFTITPQIGLASYQVNKYTKEGKEHINSTNTIYTLEIGKDWFNGRLFISSTYCNNLIYFSLGMKAFLK